MRNLASLVTREAITEVLEESLRKRPNLIASTRFHLVYKNENFPPKEVVRMAARRMGIRNLDSYRLVGGKSTNKHLEAMGFKIEQFNHSQINRLINGKPANEQRIARLTFNSNGWEYPSGWEGKSKQKAAYETANGYGHEEWLLDFTKLVDGYHYAYLEPINRGRNKHEGKILDIFLFTVNSLTDERLWVGKLNNCEVIDIETAERIKDIYHENGWIDEMHEDLGRLEIDSDKLHSWNGISLFNIRFKPEDFERYPEKTYVAANDPAISSYHYVLLNVAEQPLIETEADGKFVPGRCNPGSRTEGKTITKKFERKIIEYPALHHQISRALEKCLKKEGFVVYPEQQTGYKTSVDLYATKGKKDHFFEIKTYSDPMTCIRMALGQLIEYSYYPNRHLADQLYIVTPHVIKSQKVLDYLQHLRDHLGLPINYIGFDVEKKAIRQRL